MAESYGSLLTKGIKSGAKSAGSAISNAVTSPLPQQIPMESLIGALKGLLQTQVGQNPIGPIASGSMSSMGLNPIQENDLKTVNKVRAKQIEEAMNAGESAESILQTSGIPNLNPGQLQNSPTVGYNNQMNLNQPILNSLGASSTGINSGEEPETKNILSQLINFISKPSSTKDGVYNPGSSFGGFIQESNDSALAGQQAASLKLKAMGKEPIQPYEQLQQDTELAKTAYTTRASFAKEQRDIQSKAFEKLNDPLSSAKDLSLVESALTGIDDITNLLKISSDENGNITVGNAGLLKDMNFLNKNRQQLQRARDLYINKTLRRDSGAAIGKKEEDDFKKIIGFDIGMKSFMQNPKVIAKAMLESRDQLKKDRANLDPNSESRKFKQFLEAKGLTPAQQKQVMGEAGFLG